jgi:hypothetical protein
MVIVYKKNQTLKKRSCFLLTRFLNILFIHFILYVQIIRSRPIISLFDLFIFVKQALTQFDPPSQAKPMDFFGSVPIAQKLRLADHKRVLQAEITSERAVVQGGAQ